MTNSVLPCHRYVSSDVAHALHIEAFIRIGTRYFNKIACDKHAIAKTISFNYQCQHTTMLLTKAPQQPITGFPTSIVPPESVQHKAMAWRQLFAMYALEHSMAHCQQLEERRC